MMIEVDNAPKYRCCQLCYSDKNVIEIAFRSERQGVVVAMCEKCANDLKIILRERYDH